MRATGAGVQALANCRAARSRLAASGKSHPGISSSGAHGAEHAEQEGRAGRLLENALRRFPLAHRNIADPRKAQQVVQHQRGLFQFAAAGAGCGATPRTGSQYMTLRRWQREDLSQRGGILFSLITLAAVLLVLAVLYLARHPIFRLMGEGWVVEDTLERSDAILVLSDDNFYADRATRASQVYRQGLGAIVVASGRRLRPYAGIAELIEHDLIERGVPRDKILRVAHDADNTREEAKTLAQIAAQKKWRRVIVVTSNFLTHRATFIFSHVSHHTINILITVPTHH